MPPSPPRGGPGGLHRTGPFACFGQRWQFSSHDGPLIELLRSLYAPMSVRRLGAAAVAEYQVEPGRGGHGGTIFRDGELVAGGLSSPRLMGKLVWAVNRQVIDNAAEHRVLFHASAAADASGRVVLLPAPMESGKTTLVTGLLDRGLRYLTDEAAAVETDRTVRGFAKPLSIDPGAWDLLPHHAPALSATLMTYMTGQWQVPPDGFTEVAASGKLALIVFPSYRAGSPTSFVRLGAVDALDLARASTFAQDERPLRAVKLTRLARLVSAVPCYTMRSGDLANACTTVLEALDDPSD
jgi:hypothetical protein